MRIANAAATWNKLPGVERFEVHKSPSVALNSDPCAELNGVPIGGVLQGQVAGSTTLAENRSCVDTDTGQPIGFRQTFNKKKKFYIGSGDPPAKKLDLQAVATHELGHSEGWTGDHYQNRNNSKICANKPKQATMCPAAYSGTNRLRTLTKDDKNPVIAAYSQPFASDAFAALGLRAPAGKASNPPLPPAALGRAVASPVCSFASTCAGAMTRSMAAPGRIGSTWPGAPTSVSARAATTASSAAWGLTTCALTPATTRSSAAPARTSSTAVPAAI